MTQEEFLEISKDPKWDLVLWDDWNMYRLSSIMNGSIETSKQLGLTNTANGDYDVLNLETCHRFNYKLSGEGKAILHMTVENMKNYLNYKFRNI